MIHTKNNYRILSVGSVWHGVKDEQNLLVMNPSRCIQRYLFLVDVIFVNVVVELGVG